MSLFKKLYYFGLWLLGNKLGLMGGDSLTVEIPTKVPDSEYEALARSFLPYDESFVNTFLKIRLVISAIQSFILDCK